MHRFGLIVLTLTTASWAADNGNPSSPIYRVTVVQRSLEAVNYGHRTLPTKLDFRGTVLLPEARGDATVQALPGAVSIRAKFRGLPAPSRYGANYMTYVLWAVSPQGHAERLGELLTNHSDDAKLDVTSTLQVFGLLVTAEPYFAVSKPSAVVVMENVVRPDTVGSTQPITATYELLPRDENVTIDAAPTIAQTGAKVSQKEYEALLAIYQAQNAIQIARAEGAAENAREALEKAQRLEAEAERIPNRKENSARIVMTARQAAQTAEEAREIASHRATVASQAASPR